MKRSVHETTLVLAFAALAAATGCAAPAEDATEEALLAWEQAAPAQQTTIEQPAPAQQTTIEQQAPAQQTTIEQPVPAQQTTAEQGTPAPAEEECCDCNCNCNCPAPPINLPPPPPPVQTAPPPVPPPPPCGQPVQQPPVVQQPPIVQQPGIGLPFGGGPVGLPVGGLPIGGCAIGCAAQPFGCAAVTRGFFDDAFWGLPPRFLLGGDLRGLRALPWFAAGFFGPLRCN